MSFMKIFLLTILLSQTRANDQTFDVFVSNTIAQKCPNQRFCPREGHNSNASNTMSTCCQQCSCDKGCEIREACCLEHQVNSSESSDRNLTCRTALFSMLRSDPNYQYLVVDKCPDDYKKENISRNCQVSSPKTFDQAQIVSDSQGIIFKNYYCAVCNGVHTFNRWLTRIDCVEQLDKDVYDAELKFWLEHHCRVWFEEPKEQEFTSLRCNRAQIDTCNVSKRLSKYNPHLDKACSTMVTGRFLELRVYKNVFCFLCNEMDDHEPFCDDLNRISAGISFSGKKRSDMLKDVCRDLKCPSLNVPSRGQCKPFLDDLDGFGFEIGIHLRPTLQLNSTTLDRHWLVANITARVREQVEKSNVYNCKVCRYVGVSNASMPDGLSNYVFVRLKTTHKCQPAQVHVIAASFRGLELNVSSDGSDYQFTTHIMAKTSVELNIFNDRSGLNMYDDQPLPCSGKWAMYENTCAHVELNGVDYLNALEKNYIDRKKHRSTFIQLKTNSSEELEKLRYVVCVDEYTALRKSLAGVNSFEKINVHGILITYVFVFMQVYIQL